MGRGERRKSVPFRICWDDPFWRGTTPSSVNVLQGGTALCLEWLYKLFCGPTANMKYTKQRRVYKAALIAELPVRKLGQICEGSWLCSGQDGDWFLVQTEGFFLSADAAHSCFLPIHGHVPTCSEVLEMLWLDEWLRALQPWCPFWKQKTLLLSKLSQEAFKNKQT